jgi:tripartite-type tricarboxylate transporter receptor subunit TctC
MPTRLARRTALRFALAAAIGAAAAPLGAIGPAAAQGGAAWPTRPIRLLVAYAPGGGTDAIARTLAAQLQAELGQPVVVENKPGAGGNLATETAATARPDGYTLLMGNQGPMSVNPTLFPRFRVNPETTLEPVALVADAPLVVVAGPGTRAATLRELVEEARRKGGDLTYASAGNGSASHLAAALLLQMAGAEGTHVPYRGAGPALTEVVAGNVAFMATTLPSVVGLLQGGQLRALAVTGEQRVASMAEVPTVAEAAGLPGYRATAWYGILVPKGTPAPIRARLAEAIQKSLAMPEVVQRLQEEGAEPARMDGEAFGRLIREERVRWAEVIRAARITAD